ncbi:LysR substrate-binding domain-containing protein [Aestuariivita sp.]|uniref:LysR substrate-binding domain-containing protein n=1 Tax=Aestuariivita sp. TaxID=1872407 RepID=UPI002170AC44|nr:LysR substrate-binding domain-containing protein [Aestuariivita sp.]MCE8006435.1 LysR family transcriptional regulator [Aestuariivita sp.]
MPTLQQLRYLIALADTLHFRRAAEMCHVTQPTLSAQLKGLELKLGAELVERSRSHVIITPLGQAVVDRARRALREVDEIHTLAAQSHSHLQSTIRVGVVQSLGSYLLPLIVPGLHQSHPALKLYMREGLPDYLLQSLSDGTVDLLFFPLPVRRADFESLSIFREPIEIVLPCDHPYAAEREIAPAMLRGETILSLEPGHKLYEQVRRICEQYGADLSRDYEGTSLDTLRQMVAMGMGLSLMPALYVKSEVAHQDIVVARQFRGSPPSRTIGMIWRKGTAREAEFRELAAQICAILKERAKEVIVLG